MGVMPNTYQSRWTGSWQSPPTCRWGSLCGRCSLSRFLEGAGRRGGHSKWRDSADYRRCRSRRPSGHRNRPLDGCDSDRRRSWRQAVGRRHVHQHQGQGSRRRGQAPDQQQRAWIWCSMLSAARCSSRRSNRSASAEGRWRSRASAAGASNSIRSISYYDLKRLIGVDSMKFS
jgi:hypothetical protein